MTYTQQEIQNFYSKYSCCFAALATDYTNSLAIGAFDCGQKLNKLLQFKSYLDILKNYKVDNCIINQPLVGTFGPQIDLPDGVDADTIYSFYKNDVLISDSYTIESIVKYFISLGFGSITQVPFFKPDLYTPLVGWEDDDYDYPTQVLYTINPSLFYELSNTTTGTINPPNYTDAPLYATYGDIPDTYEIVLEGSDTNPTITWGKLVLKEENCENYTEEELNCITNDNLDTILFWLKQNCLTVKNKPIINEIECTPISEDLSSISLDSIVVIQAGEGIQVSRKGNVYTITNSLPDQEITIEEGANITVTGTYPNFTIASSGGSGGISDGDKGDITVSSSGTVWTIDNNVVTNSKVASGIDASKISSGNVSNTEFDYLNNVSSNIQTQLDNKVDENASITGATKTKITYDTKGLVTSGADATTADISDSTNRRYVTDAQLTVIGNTSGTNSGDQNLFSTIAVSGQSNVVADSTTDTLTLVAGTNVTITTDATTDSITISASGGGGGGTPGGSDTQVQFNDSGSFGGDSGFTYNKTTDIATIGGVNLSNETASRVAIIDGSKNVKSADTATYPSLTELSYVKGATSSIQTQLNAKLAIASGNNYRLTATDGSGNRGDISAITASRVLVSDANGLPTHSSITESILNNLPYTSKISSAGDGTGVTGTTSSTLSKSLLIPANSRAADSCSHIEVAVKKVGTAGTLAVRIYWNTSNSLTGAILIASSTGNAASTLWLTMIRTLGIEVAAGTGNGTTVLNTAVSTNNQYGVITSAVSNVAIDWTVAGYFIVAVQNGSSADTSTCNQILLH